MRRAGYLAESGSKHSLLRRVVAQIRLWLAKMGLGNLSDAEIEMLIAKAARHQDPTSSMASLEQIRSPAYKRTM